MLLVRVFVLFFILLVHHVWKFLIRWKIIIIHIILTLRWDRRNRETFSFKDSSRLLINVFIYVALWVLFFNSGEILLCVASNLSSISRSYMGFNLLPIFFEQTNCFYKLFMLISWPSASNLGVFLSESLLIWINLRMRHLFSKVELLPSCSSFFKLISGDAFCNLDLLRIFLSFFIFTTVVSRLINTLLNCL